MSIPSNLYAEKIFSEHPLALWALDDKLDYVSLISESQRNILGLWSKTNCTAYSGTSFAGESPPSNLTKSIPATGAQTLILAKLNLSNGIFSP